MKVKLSLQEKQREAFFKSLETPVLFYGGAKGGGKSYLIRAREIFRRLTNEGTSGLIVRKTYPELLANHIRKFFVEYPFIRNWYNKSEKTIYYPNGSTTEFSYLQNTDDVYTYQGREYEDVSIDEITQHEEEVFKILRTSVRTSNKDFAKASIPSMLLTGNPGGIGHAWVKRLFIDSNLKEEEDPDEFNFVQAKVFDNKALLDADPAYIRRLQDLPDDLRRAYLDGDWDIFAGQVFGEFRRDSHVIKPYLPSQRYPHFLWIDWGYSGKESHEGAFAAYSSSLIKTSYQGETFNRVITYQEWYGKYKTPEEWAEAIYQTSPIPYYREGRTDPAMHNTQTSGAVSIAELMMRKWKTINAKKNWINLKKGSNNRIERVATVHNWLSMAPDGLPYWLISERCPHLIRTLPLLVYDETNPEDVDTEGEDHPYDAVGYGLSSVRFIPANLGGITKPRPTTKKVKPATLMELDLKKFERSSALKQKDWRVL
jgi:phage terminase large subunit